MSVITVIGVPRLAFPAALQRIRPHAPILVSALVVVVFGLYLAAQVADWLQLIREPAEQPVGEAQPVGVVPDLQRMSTLFGTPANSAYTPDTAHSDLTLLGSFVHADPARSTAIVQLSGSPPQLYRVGEELQSGLSLKSVHPDRVEIQRNGRIENLFFPTTRAVTAVPDNLPDYSEPAPMDAIDPQAEMLQQQMEALRQQMEGSAESPETLPTDEQNMEDD